MTFELFPILFFAKSSFFSKTSARMLFNISLCNLKFIKPAVTFISKLDLSIFSEINSAIFTGGSFAYLARDDTFTAKSPN